MQKFRMTKLKTFWFPIFLSIVLIILSLCPTNGEKSSTSSKARKRYRSHLSVVSKTEQDQFPNSNYSNIPETVHNNNETSPSSDDVYYSHHHSRAMPIIPPPDFTNSDLNHRTGLDLGDREEDILQPFSPDFAPWTSNNNRPSGSSSSSSKLGQGSGSSSLKESYPVGSPRYGLTSAEKFDKFSNNNNYGGSNGQQLYSSYPLGVEKYSSSSSSNNNPLLDTYPYYEKERDTRDKEQQQQQRAARDLLINAAAASKLNALQHAMAYPSAAGVLSHPAVAAAAASSLFSNSVVPPTDFEGYGDALALASGHGHGHGWGWGWKEPQHHHDHGSDMNSSAVGLLGLLGLLSLLSNILLILLTTTTTAAARKKRSTSGFGLNMMMDEESEEAKRMRIFYQLLPFLSPVAHVRNGLIPTECILQGVCLTNKVLVKEYGVMGRTAGNRVTDGITKLLSEIYPPSNGDKKRNNVETAGLHGRNQRNCQKVYPVCHHMKKHGHLNVPFMIRMEQVPHLFERLKKQTSYSPMNL